MNRNLICLVLVLVPFFAGAQIVPDGATNTLSNVTNTITGDVTVGTNGSFTLLVLSTNSLLTNSVNGVIGLNSTALSNEAQLVSSSARWLMGGSLYVGSNGVASRLMVTNGSTVRAGRNGVIGANTSASSNSVSLSDPGTTWTVAGDLYVGSNGPFSQLTINNGASLVSSNAVLGWGNPSSSNFALVTGTGSLWSNQLDFTVGSVGPANRVEVNGGGRLVNNNAIIGQSLFSPSNAVVVAGTGSLWSNRAELWVGGVGQGNLLVVTNGGWVVSSNGYVGNSGFGNLAVVTGTNSTWSNRVDLHVGNVSRAHELVVSNGARVFVGRHSVIGINTTANSNSVTVTDPGTSWLVASNLYVGSNGAFNRLVVSNGATVADTLAFLGRSFSSSNNLALVTGPGSVWSNSYLGFSGPGNRLTVSNGGVLQSFQSDIGGVASSSNNLAIVTGSGSTWTNGSDFYVSIDGSGNQLLVSDGGLVRNTGGFVGNNSGTSNNVAVITGAGSLWNNALNLRVGGNNAAFCSLIVSNGGTVIANSDSYIGFNAISTNNAAVVTDPGSFWSNGTNVYVGNSGSGNFMVVSNGGLVSDFDGVIGNNSSSSNNTVVVTGTNSTWTNFADFVVGVSGNSNRVVVTNGGVIICDSGTIGGFGNGNQALVTGPGSRWSFSGDHLFVGYSSNANQLVISNGAAVLGNNAYIGENFSSRSNFALVTGSGSVWSNADQLHVGDFGSYNRLVVTNGGMVFAGSNLFVGQGVTSGSNRIVIDGGILLASNVLGTAALNVRRGTNVLNAGLIDVDQLITTNSQGFFEFNGGTLITRGAIISNGVPFTISTSVSSPALWDVRAGPSNHVLSVELYVGSNSSLNQLSITNGGSFANTFGNLGWLSSSSNNVATVAGAGSTWSNQFDLLVGRDGRGNQLLVRNGGVVRSEFGFLGFNAVSSNNTALVEGSGSMWSIITDLLIGRAGSGSLLVVSNGALVAVGGGVFVGNNPGSTNSRVIVDGGMIRATNLAATGALDIRRGTNVLNAGLIETDILRLTNTLSRFEFNGGTLSVKGSRVGNTFTAGNGVSTASLIFAGNGTHDFSGGAPGLVVSSNATLTGNGSLAGILIVQSGGNLIPGTSVGKIVLSNSPSLQGATVMEISINGGALTNDQIQVIGGLTYGASLVVSNLGPSALAAGDRFQLFNATSYAGSFTSLTLPPLGPRLEWKNNLLVDGSIVVSAPPAIPLTSGSYTQDFNSLSISGGANLWRDNSTLLGWYAAKTISPTTITNYRASDGSENNGALYSFGSTGSNERALGSIASDSVGTISYGLAFTNDTGGDVSNFAINYAGEQWRSGGDGTNTLTVWYRVSSSALTNPEPGIVTNWTQVTNLSFVTPTVLTNATALNGNQATNRQMFSSVLVSGLVVPAGQNVFFRWRDLNDSGADQGMAVDDFVLTFLGPPADRFWTNPLGGNYEIAANWLSNTVPLFHDTAHFTSNATYQINWGADALAANAYFDAAGGTVTQAVGSASWTLTGGYIVGRDAAATATVTHVSGILRVTNSVGTAVFKAGEAGGGTFNLAGGEVVTDTLLVTNASKSVFNFPGGTLRSRNTTINNGSRLTVGTNTTAGTFELLGGTHTFANGLTIQPNSLLTGTGNISANISINLNGSVSPGPAQGGIGPLNFNGALNFASTTTNLFDINKSAATNDTLTCSSSITLNGTLVVTNLGGTLTNGDRFKLFTGSFGSIGFTKLILPPLAAGLSWKNDTHKDGSLQVVPTPARDFGEDVSHFQGASGVSQASWDQMFAEGKRFVFIKATEGLTGPHDAAMATNVERALAAGLLAGVYHFAHPENRPTTNGAILEASNMVVYAGSAIGPGRLRPVLDIEGSAATLSTTALTDWVIAFSDEIIAQRGPGAAPIIYTLQSFANSELDSRVANYDLWIRSVSDGSDPQADDPPAQGFSTNALGVFSNWSFWQYSDTGNSGGISPLDLDVCHSEYKPLSSYLIPGVPPAPIQLTGTTVSINGAVQFSFTNSPGATFSVLATTNLSVPVSNWTVLGAAVETSPGLFQFTDPQATNNPGRFYRVRWP